MANQENKTEWSEILAGVVIHDELEDRVGSLNSADKRRIEIECREIATSFEVLWIGAVVAFVDGKLVEAVDLFCRALELEPRHALASVGLGKVMGRLAQREAAAECYSQAIQSAPSCVEAFFYRGNARLDQGRLQEAIADYLSALALAPDFLQAHNNLGMALTRAGQHTQARMTLEEAVRLAPHQPEVHCNLGVAHFNCNEFEKSLASYDRALALSPDYTEALNNRGNALMEMGRLTQAIQSYEAALAVKPTYVEATWNKALALLTTGDYAQGWRLHECRWDRPAFAPIKRNFSQPLWLGKENLRGKTILLHCEQGMGDAIQFCRYAPIVSALGASVVLEVDAALMALMASLGGVDTLVLKGSTLPPFNFHCPLMSLPLAMGTDIGTVPAPSAYLQADPDRLAKWRQRLGPRSTGGRIGLVCSGDPQHRNDHNRTIPLRQLLPHLPGDRQYVILQRDLRDGDRAVIHSYPNVLSFEDHISDFADTAALCCLVDQVISVDTSVAHLSAALGRPTHILLPACSDWRWLRGRADSPWYPSVRLYRQTEPGQWTSLVEILGKAILSVQ